MWVSGCYRVPVCVVIENELGESNTAVTPLWPNSLAWQVSGSGGLVCVRACMCVYVCLFPCVSVWWSGEFHVQPRSLILHQVNKNESCEAVGQRPHHFLR